MPDKPKTYHWQLPTWPEGTEIVECPAYDPYGMFKRDPSGYYVLIRIEWDLLKLAVAICDKKHKIVKVFRGRCAAEIYEEIFRYEKAHRQKWFFEKSHIAYLGKELKKAELAMAIGVKDYFQE